MRQLERGHGMQFAHDVKGYRYYRNAVERHWDPHEIDLSRDTENIAELTEEGLFAIRRAIALFGAGEQAVTEELAPLAVALDTPEDQLFITTQLYEEAKHADFFDRYWRTVIHTEETHRGLDTSSPLEERWFNDSYIELFDRNERALHRLLEENTAKNRAIAYCHYHLTIEGILAQTGYYGLQTSYGPGDEVEELPYLPGLYEGLSSIRSDEGRHVGFGMAKLKDMVALGRVPPDLLHETVNDLIPLVNGVVQPPDEVSEPVGLGPAELTGYAAEKHTERMSQIMNADMSIPGVDELTALESD